MVNKYAYKFGIMSNRLEKIAGLTYHRASGLDTGLLRLACCARYKKLAKLNCNYWNVQPTVT